MKNIFITGVSTGLGNAMAKYFLDENVNVFGLSRSTPEDLLTYDNFYFKNHDLSNLNGIEGRLDQLLGIQEVDLVVLNAGVIGEYGDLAKISVGDAKRVEDINVWANKVILDYCLVKDISLQQVIAISSGASVSGARGWSAYGVSKAALNMLIQLYAAEMPKTHFCALAPGVLDTGMQEYLYSLDQDDKYPTLGVLQSLKANKKMPSAESAAQDIIDALPKIRETIKSGSYADIRKL